MMAENMTVTIDVETPEALETMASAITAAAIRIRDLEATNVLLNENLTAVQAKCTELLERARRAENRLVGQVEEFADTYPSNYLQELQADHKAWADRNFPNREPLMPVLGVVEEVGELCHALLKGWQGIRGTKEQHEAGAKDAVGDIVIFLLDVCSQRGWSFAEIVAETWAEVRKRDWTKKGAG